MTDCLWCRRVEISSSARLPGRVPQKWSGLEPPGNSVDAVRTQDERSQLSVLLRDPRRSWQRPLHFRFAFSLDLANTIFNRIARLRTAALLRFICFASPPHLFPTAPALGGVCLPQTSKECFRRPGSFLPPHQERGPFISMPELSCAPSGRSHNRGGAGSATSRSASAKLRLASRFRDSQLRNSVRIPFATYG